MVPVVRVCSWSSSEACLTDGVRTTVPVDSSPRGVVAALLCAMGLRAGSIAELHPDLLFIHFTLFLCSALMASLSLSHFLIFSTWSCLLAFSYALLLSATVRAREANSLAELLVGVSTSSSPVAGLMPCTPR